jgi:hypothetical protein
MSDSEPTMAFIARQLLEINGKLGALTSLETEVKQMALRLNFMKGWMDGQEEVTESQSKRLSEINGHIERVARTSVEYRARVDTALSQVVDLHTKLGGLAELGKSTYDMVAEMKAALGGDDASTKSHKQQAATI